MQSANGRRTSRLPRPPAGTQRCFYIETMLEQCHLPAGPYSTAGNIKLCSGTLINPLDSEDLFYITYYLGTWQDWKGNTTGRFEYRVYGKEPVFATSGHLPPNTLPLYVDINGGKSFSYEWSNIRTPYMNVGVQYYRELTPFENFLFSIGWNYFYIPLMYITILIIIIGLVIIRKTRKKRKLHISLLF